MFRVRRNTAIRETELLRALRDALASALPSTWSMVSQPELGRGDKRADAVIQLTGPDRSSATIFVEAKRVAEPRDVMGALRQLAAYRQKGDESLLVVAPYLSPRTRELLQEAGAGWFDATGNFRLQIDRPAVFIERSGASRNPFSDADDRRLKSLKGPSAARIVRALLDEQLPIGVRALAEVAEVGAATSSRVSDLLVREELANRDEDGRITDVKKASLVRRWSSDYGISSSNQPVPVLAPRGLDQVITSLRGYKDEYAVTAEAAARAYLPKGSAAVAPLSLLTVFVPNAVTASESLALRPAERGANVVLVEPFDDVVFRGTTKQSRLTYAAASQVVADLLTGPGRAPEEAKALIETLAKSDEAWSR